LSVFGDAQSQSCRQEFMCGSEIVGRHQQLKSAEFKFEEISGKLEKNSRNLEKATRTELSSPAQFHPLLRLMFHGYDSYEFLIPACFLIFQRTPAKA
jgi:hypothetical protein